MYYWYKKELWKETFPPTLEHIFKEALSNLRPKLKLCKSYEEAQTEVNNIRSTLGIGKYYNQRLELSNYEIIAFFRKNYS